MVSKAVNNLIEAGVNDPEFKEAIIAQGEQYSPPAYSASDNAKKGFALLYIGFRLGKGTFNAKDYE